MKSDQNLELNFIIPSDLCDSILNDLRQRLKVVGLELHVKPNDNDGSYWITISSVDHTIYNTHMYVFLDCSRVAQINRLIEQQALENYLNQNLLRMASVGWQITFQEVESSDQGYAKGSNVILITTAGSEEHRYPLCEESIYHIECALYRAEMNRAALRYYAEMQRLIAQEEHPWWVDVAEDGIRVEYGEEEYKFYSYGDPTALRSLKAKMAEFARHAGLPPETSAEAASQAPASQV